MNAARVATLLRELADALEAPGDDRDVKPDNVEERAPVRPRKVTEMDKARAERIARRLA